jgi:hypothetical protein
LHPGAILNLLVCGECIYEEDYNLRDADDMCQLEPPGIGDSPIRPGRMQVRIRRSLLRRRYRVEIEGDLGLPWAIVTPPVNTRESAERAAATVSADVATLPLRALREKY